MLERKDAQKSSNFSLLLRKTVSSRAQRSDKLCISDAKFPNV